MKGAGADGPFDPRDPVAVLPLVRMEPGSVVRVVHLACRVPERLAKLSGFGLVPGATLRVRQRRPSWVVSIGETTLALDADVAAEVYVSRLR